MHMQKFSISLSSALVKFIHNYQIEHACKSCSEVIQKALSLLQRHELEQHYREAVSETDSDFEITAFDGLDIEMC
jgi:antitoxin ParD1/3/4